ncbi:MAG: GNAT family N-acetyltransferase [Candidatus Latescibacteria bacterium]|nr:GNAT family N-acetyltransferase [Candidatus Latescibacterota bacterium]
MLIRPAEPRDLDVMVRFNTALAQETEGVDLDPERLRRGIRALLEDPQKGFYLLAEEEDGVVGQIMVTFEWSDWRDGVFYWIQSVYVRPDRRRQGVFRALYRSVEHTARERPGVCGLRLYVVRGNAQAQQTYRTLGMNPTPFEMLEVDFVIDRHET